MTGAAPSGVVTFLFIDGRKRPRDGDPTSSRSRHHQGVLSTPGIGAKHVMVYLLPAALRMNALNVAIPRLTCSDAQRPGWLEVYFGDDGSCLLKQKSTMPQSLSQSGRKALRCAIVDSRSGATDLAHYTPHWVWREMACAAAVSD
jgi:hypothetical protein